MLIFNVNAPVATIMFFKAIFEIAAFDFIEVEPFMNRLLRQEPTGALTDKLDALGLSSLYMFNNMGSFGIFFALYLIALFVLPYFGYIAQRMAYLTRKLQDKMIWGFLITSVKESSAVISLSIFINLKSIKWAETGDFVHNLIALAFLYLVAIFPLYCIWMLRTNFDWLDERYLRRRFGAWREGLDLRQGPRVLFWPTFFILRRLHLAATVIFIDNFLLQVLMLLLQVFISVSYLGWTVPWKSKQTWYKQFLEEIFLLAVCYHLILFTPIVESHET